MPLETPTGPQRVGVVIPAAGLSRRMGGVDKVFATVLGRSLLSWTIDAFDQSPVIDEIVIAIDRHHIQEGRALVAAGGWSKVSQVCRGGLRRQDSVREALWRLAPCDWVLVHDGARPCVSQDLIRQALMEAQEWGAAVPALPVTDTIKRTDDAGVVTETVAREGLWAVQTPQAFSYPLLWAAHQNSEDATDDAALVERLGKPVRLFPGASANIKVTVAEDLAHVEAYLRTVAPSLRRQGQ